MMRDLRFITIVILVLCVTLNTYAQQDDMFGGYTPAQAPTTSFQSTTSYQTSGYTVPVSARDLNNVGIAATPYSSAAGRRNAPPIIDKDDPTPDLPGYSQPLGDGWGILLLAVLIYAVTIIRRREVLNQD
jgi:hypothetical protein